MYLNSAVSDALCLGALGRARQILRRSDIELEWQPVDGLCSDLAETPRYHLQICIFIGNEAGALVL